MGILEHGVTEAIDFSIGYKFNMIRTMSGKYNVANIVVCLPLTSSILYKF